MKHPWRESLDWPDYLKPLSCPDDLALPAVLAQHRDLALARAQLPQDPSVEVQGCPHQVRVAFSAPVEAESVVEALTWRSYADASMAWPLEWESDPSQMTEAMQQELAVVLTLLRSPDISKAWRIDDDFSVDVLDAIMARGYCVALRAALASPTCPALDNLQARHGQASLGFTHPRALPWLHAAIAMDSPLAPVLLEHGFNPCQRDYKGQPAWVMASSAQMLDRVLAHIHAPLSREDLGLGLSQWANSIGKNTYRQRVEVLQRHARRWQQPDHDVDVAQAMVLVERRKTPMRADGAMGWAVDEVTASHLQSLCLDVWRTPVVEPSWPLADKRMTLADSVAWRTMSEAYPTTKYGVSKVLASLPADVHSVRISGQVPGVFLRQTVMLVEKDLDAALLRDIAWNPEVVASLACLQRTPADARRGPGLHLPCLAKSLGGWAQTWKMSDKVNPAIWDMLHELVQQTGMDLNQAPDTWVTAAAMAAQSPRLTHEGACALGRMLAGLFNNLNIEGDYAIDKLQRKEGMKVLDVLLEMEPPVPALANPRLPAVVEALIAQREDAPEWEGLKRRLRARALESQWPEDSARAAPGPRL